MVGAASTLRTRLDPTDPAAAPLWLGAILILGALLRLVVCIKFQDFHIASAIIWEFGDMGRCAVKTGGDLCLYTEDNRHTYLTAFEPPLGGYLWMLLFKLFGATAKAMAGYAVVNIAAGVGSIYLMYRVALRFGADQLASLLAAAIIAFYPTFFYLAATYHTTNPSIFVFLVLLLSLARFTDETASWNDVALGLIAGVNVLLRTEMAPIGGIFILAAAALAWRNGKGGPMRALVPLVAMGLVVLPWVVRNWIQFHMLIPTVDSGSYAFWNGFSHYANGSGHMYPGLDDGRLADRLRVQATVAFGPNYEPRVMAAFAADALQAIKAAPARAIGLIGVKVAKYWLIDWHDLTTHSVLYWLPWLAVNPLALLGLWRLWKQRFAGINTVLLISFAVTAVLLTAAYAATAVHPRYRMHVEPLLFVLAGIGLGPILMWIWSRVAPPKAVLA